MLEPLSRLILEASRRGQVFVVTHSEGLARLLEGAAIHMLQKHAGATSIAR
jgi:predicted ATPase